MANSSDYLIKVMTKVILGFVLLVESKLQSIVLEIPIDCFHCSMKSKRNLLTAIPTGYGA